MRQFFRPLPRTVTGPLSILVLVCWAAVMALLINRSYLQASSATLAADLARYTSAAVWHGVYYRGEKIGFTVSQTVPTDAGFDLEESGRLILDIFNPSFETWANETFPQDLPAEPPFTLPDGRVVVRHVRMTGRNPFTQVLQDIRAIVLYPDLDKNKITVAVSFGSSWARLIPIAIALCVFAFGLFYFRRNQHAFAEQV